MKSQGTLGKAAAMTLLLAGAGTITGSAGLAAEPKWRASPPAGGQDSGLWSKLLEGMQSEGLDFGAMAAAGHMIAFFPDVAGKEAAYKAVISIIDRGYPVLVRDIFIPGDLEPDPGSAPDEYRFANNYYLYKAMINREKSVQHWADYYLGKVDKDGFPKYLFFSALEAYAKGDLKTAEDLLNKALAKDLTGQPPSFITKVARTLARIYFEEGEYEKCLDVYDSFLLKLNPIMPSDWLEAAWAEFHLKRYDEALGLLYNLESRAGNKEISLEKYNIRALIYRAICSITNMEQLMNSFNESFGPVLDGIKHGESLAGYPILLKLDLPENAELNQVRLTINSLLAESRHIRRLPAQEAALAGYVYQSEIRMLRRKLRQLAPEAIERAASQILTISEQMRFLKFDIERSKFDPDQVFKPVSEETQPKAVTYDADSETYKIRWIQNGDYWLDERTKFKGILPNQCSE